MLVAGGFAPPRSVGKGLSAVRRWVEYGRWKRAHPVLVTRALRAVPVVATATRSLSETEGKQQLAAAGVRLLPNALVDKALSGRQRKQRQRR